MVEQSYVKILASMHSHLDSSVLQEVALEALAILCGTGKHRPITPVENRVCQYCNILEDEFHFPLMCNQKSRYVTVR